MTILIKILQLCLCFTLLVGIHELGHFVMARIFKIRVEKFYIFFDPWFSLFKFKRGGTEFGLGWLPLGGYVKIAGMIDESLDTEQMQQPVQPDEFRAKPAWQRFLVMIAGVVMNLLLAVVIYSCICYTWGDAYFSNRDARWGYNFNAAGHALGFRDGDRILTIDGKEIDNYTDILNSLLITETGRTVVVERDEAEVTLDLKLDQLIAMRASGGYKDFLAPRLPFVVDSVIAPAARAAGLLHGDEVVAVDEVRGGDFTTLRERILQSKGDTVTLELLRPDAADAATRNLLTLRVPVGDEGIGVLVDMQPFQLRTRTYTLAQSLPAGIRKAGSVMGSYWEQLKLIVQPKTQMYKELGGFIAIGSIFPGAWDWQDFWMKCAFLSIILAVMNILPIPGLDGGHALFTFWEMVTGRRLSDKFLEVAQYIGMAIILLLLLYANGNDIYRFLVK